MLQQEKQRSLYNANVYDFLKFSKNKDVVFLYPLIDLKAKLLFKLLKIVIKIFTDAGYQIATIIAGNNSVIAIALNNSVEAQYKHTLSNAYATIG